jgi:hypothetical protein
MADPVGDGDDGGPKFVVGEAPAEWKHAAPFVDAGIVGTDKSVADEYSPVSAEAVEGTE